MHEQVLAFVARERAGLVAPRVVEVGSCDVNGSVRPLFTDAVRYHGIDVVAGPGVDEVADAADWRPGEQYDVAVSTEVLEHAPRWPAIVAMMWDALAPGGRLLLTCATDPRPPHSAVDGWAVRPGEHYANVAPLDALAVVRDRGCTTWRVEHHADRGDLYLRADHP